MNDFMLGIKELDSITGSIKKGSNIMLIGPPMSGKETILNNIMYNGAVKNGNAVIKVTTRNPASQILEWFNENNMSLPDSKIGIIDCITKTLGKEAVETENIKIANSPVDLTGIGVKISQFFEDFFIKKKIAEIQLHVDSLSTLMMYSNIQTVFRFLHVFTGRIKAAGAMGLFLVEDGMHDEKDIITLKQLFDGLIEVKIENDSNFIRVVGLSSKPTPWFEFEIDGARIKILGGK
ncbi:MAG: ATPase domain-containing protein [Candidatus Methanoperedens sp.]|nr:ATPase domain-containing protein [Candidatus Methanoperedens sp.]